MCAVHIPQNFYRQTITRAVTLTTGVNIYVSAHPTPAEGYIAISPASTNLREIVYYTAKGTDGNGTYITVTTANRGLGGTTAQTHAIGEPVRMNVSAETIQEISDALDQIVAAGAQDATVSIKGISKGASETELGIVEEATDAEVTAGTATGATGAKLFVTPAKLKSSGILKFGGTGADGVLAITSGATNIDLAGAQVVVKNYASISITGTGSLTFTNPHNNGTIIILKSQGNVTLTSSAAPMINASGLGALGATGPTQSSSGIQNSNVGTVGYGFNLFKTNIGTATTRSGYNSGTTGANGGVITLDVANSVNHQSKLKYHYLVPSSGSASGTAYHNSGSFSVTGGTGGRGGGCLVIECGGAWNFTTTNGISVAGGTGGNASATGSDGTSWGAEGGAGGAGGMFIGLYNTLTANTGTVNVDAGVAGTNVSGGSPTWAALTITQGASILGTTTGLSLVAQNTEFA